MCIFGKRGKVLRRLLHASKYLPAGDEKVTNTDLGLVIRAVLSSVTRVFGGTNEGCKSRVTAKHAGSKCAALFHASSASC